MNDDNKSFQSPDAEAAAPAASSSGWKTQAPLPEFVEESHAEDSPDEDNTEDMDIEENLTVAISIQEGEEEESRDFNFDDLDGDEMHDHSTPQKHPSSTARDFDEHIAFRLAMVASANFGNNRNAVTIKEMQDVLNNHTVTKHRLAVFKTRGWLIEEATLEAILGDANVPLKITPTKDSSPWDTPTPESFKDKTPSKSKAPIGPAEGIFQELCDAINGANGEKLLKGQVKLLPVHAKRMLSLCWRTNEIFDNIRSAGYDQVEVEPIADVMDRYADKLDQLDFGDFHYSESDAGNEDGEGGEDSNNNGDKDGADDKATKKVRHQPITVNLKNVLRDENRATNPSSAAAPTLNSGHPILNDWETHEQITDGPMVGRWQVNFQYKLPNGHIYSQPDYLPITRPDTCDGEKLKYFLPAYSHIIPTTPKSDALWIKDDSVTTAWPGAWYRDVKKGLRQWAYPKFVMRAFDLGTHKALSIYKWGETWDKFGDEKHAGGWDINDKNKVEAYNKWHHQITSRNSKNYSKRDIRIEWVLQEMQALRGHFKRQIAERGLIETYRDPKIKEATRLVNEARAKWNHKAGKRTETAVQSMADRDSFEPWKRGVGRLNEPWPLNSNGEKKMGIKDWREEAKKFVAMEKNGQKLFLKALKPKNTLSLTEFAREIPVGKLATDIDDKPDDKDAETKNPTKKGKGKEKTIAADATTPKTVVAKPPKTTKRKRSSDDVEDDDDVEHSGKRQKVTTLPPETQPETEPESEPETSKPPKRKRVEEDEERNAFEEHLEKRLKGSDGEKAVEDISATEGDTTEPTLLTVAANNSTALTGMSVHEPGKANEEAEIADSEDETTSSGGCEA